MKRQKYIIVFVTVPHRKTALKIKDLLLKKDKSGTESFASSFAFKKSSASCVQILKNLESHYRWNNKLEVSKELLLIIKSVKSNFSVIEKLVKSAHPYEVPEIISVEISNGSKDYLSWIKQYAG